MNYSNGIASAILASRRDRNSSDRGRSDNRSACVVDNCFNTCMGSSQDPGNGKGKL